MSDWDRIFDELYLKTYAFLQAPQSGEEDARALVALLGLAPPADVLDSACGYGRHAIPLARMGFSVVAHDRSPVLLDEARRRAGDGERLRFVEGDYRELRFEDASFDYVLNLFTALGYWGDEDDLRALREFRRVLRPAGRFVLETMHRDRLARVFQERMWDPLPDGAVLLEQRELDLGEGVIRVTHTYWPETGEVETAHYELRSYTATDFVRMLRAAGFAEIELYGGFEGGPFTLDSRLLAVAH